MMELRQIVGLWRRSGTRVLVTVIRVEGSSYRRPGARLLLSETGEYAGTISGGCLETEVIRKAGWKVREGAVVERFSTMFDDTAEIPYGLGCGGMVDLLLEPVETPECSALLHAMERALRGERSTVVTWLPGEGKGLRRVVLGVAGEVVYASEQLGEKKLACAHNLHPGEEYDGRFVEEIRQPQRLFVLGAGDDARPLVAMAAMMGWSVTVADGRAQLAKKGRFMEAERVVVLSDSGVSELAISPDDAVVLMTHSYEQDRELLAALLPVAPRYLGLLGARHRSSLLVSEAAVATGLPVEVCCERIWAPVGLDLGGDGPEAIALAVVAEAQAACMDKLGGSRRLTPGDVARHVREGGVSRYLQVQCAVDVRTVNIAAIVLAAGESRRLGELKQLVRLNGERLVERAVRICLEAGCAPVVVVLGASADEIRKSCELASACLVVNERWDEGMGTSVAAGVGALRQGVEGCVILTCDQPTVSAEHLRELIKLGELAASSYAGRCGVPAFFPASRFAELKRLEGDSGAREMLRQAHALPLMGGELDVDTPEDLERVRRLFG